MAVIGIWHCPSFPDLKLAYEAFRDTVSQFSRAPVIQCFAFDPSMEHMTHSVRAQLVLREGMGLVSLWLWLPQPAGCLDKVLART